MNLERERVGISAMDLERERELTFNINHLHLKRVLEIFTERKRAWRLEIDKLEILILYYSRRESLELAEDFFIYIIFIFNYDFSKFDFLVFLCLILWVCMIFFGLCSSVFLMKRMLDLNSCIFFF